MKLCHVTPNTITFNNLLNVYAQFSNTEKAESILAQMEYD